MIQDLVTDILAPSKDAKDLPFIDTYSRKGYTPLGESDLIEYAEGVVADLKIAQPSDVPKMIARYTSVLGPSRNRQDMFLLAFDYAETGKDDYLKPIINSIEEMVINLKKGLETEKMRLVTNSLENSFDLLDSIWNEDFIDNLAALTGAKPPTIKRWKTTGKINSRSRRRVAKITAIFYQMEAELGWEKEKINDWFINPLADGKSPKEHFNNWRTGYYMPKEIREDLHRLNIIYLI